MTPPVLDLPRDLPAPRPKVWRALTEPALVARWWGPGGFTATVHAWELVPGGSYRVALASPDGGVFVAAGAFTAIEPVDLLAFTWSWEDEVGWTSRVTIRLEPTPAGTRLHLRHEGLPSPESVQSHTWGWVGAFDKLVELLSAP